jgi:pimeloyl-ACP methyl ester carboxylesterase
LQAVDQNRAESVKLAERITRLRRSDPQRRILLTGHSGGAGFAVFALEQLPPDVQVDALVMLAPAISPEYDLSAALARVKEAAYTFYSERDSLILGAGTNTFGTMDGRREASAGMVGFSLPPTAEPRQYAKLVELPYQSSWARYSNFGDHWGSLHPSFGRKVVGPLLATGMLRQ